MQVHGPGVVASRATAHLNAHDADHQFAVLDIGGFSIFVYTPDEADVLIRAAVETKRLLLGTSPENDPAIAMSAYGPAEGDVR